MAITINWPTKVISVPKADMVLVQSTPFEVRELDVNDFRLALKDLEDNEQGINWPKTHKHNTQVVLGGLSLARVVEIVNGYTITFDEGNYAVNLVGANSNVGDVVNLNSVQVRSYNSAGLIVVTSGSGVTEQDKADIIGGIMEELLTGHTTPDSLAVAIKTIKKNANLIPGLL